MINVRYPAPSFRTRKEGGVSQIFDAIRRRWVALTEEEWVRQNFVTYLTQSLSYPTSLLALEKEIRLNELKKRFDILIYDAQHQPWMLVECKAPQIRLNAAVLEQVMRYHIAVPVPYMVITNGSQTMAWQKVEGNLTELENLPTWSSAAPSNS